MFGYPRQIEHLKIIIGLGNPGAAYETTRHNVGARAVIRFARQNHWAFKANRIFKSLIVQDCFQDKEVLCVLPQTFMNLSGDAAAALVAKKRVSLKNILVVYDDVDLSLGTIRFRTSGSDGGHNGLESVIGRLGSREFSRLRIGIGPKNPSEDLSDFVLSHFDREERAIIERATTEAAEAIGTWVLEGVERSMNLYNKKNKNKAREE